MNGLNNIQAFYFIGIGGIGMSALARYVKLQGKAVHGYDKTKTDLTDELVAEGIPITFIDSVSELPETIMNKETSLVVYTPAIPKDNTLITWFLSEGYEVIKRAQFLAEVTRNTFFMFGCGRHSRKNHHFGNFRPFVGCL